MRTKKKKKAIISALVIVFVLRIVFGNLIAVNPPDIFDQPYNEIFLLAVIIIPIAEELLFRGVLVGLLNISVIFLLSIRSKNFRELNILSRCNDFPEIRDSKITRSTTVHRFLECILIGISAIFFAESHLSLWGIESFIHYFLGGLIYGFIFLRYGFFSSLFWHMIYNFLGVSFYKFSISDSISLMVTLLLFILYISFIEQKNEEWSRLFSILKQNMMFFVSIWFLISLISIIASIFLTGDSNFLAALLSICFIGLLIILDYFIVDILKLKSSNLYGLSFLKERFQDSNTE